MEIETDYSEIHLVWMDPSGSEIYLCAEEAITQSKLDELGIVTILTVNYDQDNLRSNFTVLTRHILPFKDAPEKDQTDQEKLNAAEAVNRLISSIKSGEKILVHCSAGIHRSPAVIYTALIHLGHFENAYDAYSHVSKFRSVVRLHKSLNEWVRKVHRRSL